jgi:hypothetical protein
VPEDELTSARRMIGAEEKASQRIRIDVTFESHRIPVLNVQDDAVSIIEGRHDAFRAGFPGQVKEVVPVELV